MPLPTLRSHRFVALPRGSAAGLLRSDRGRATSLASSSGGGFLALLFAWLLLFALLVVMPIAMLANGVDAAGVLGWMAMVAVSLAVTWWTERREQRRWFRRHGGPPKQPTSPCAEEFRRRWGLAEETCAEVEESGAAKPPRGFSWWPAKWTRGEAKPRQEATPAQAQEPVEVWVIDQPAYGANPAVLTAHRQTLVEVFVEERERAVAAGLQGEALVDHMASVLREVKPYGSKAAARQARRQAASAGEVIRSDHHTKRGSSE